MKLRKILYILLITCCFVSCESKKDNVILKDFTKELVSLYINDTINIKAKKRNDEMILLVGSDTSNYYLYLHSNNNKVHKICREDL